MSHTLTTDRPALLGGTPVRTKPFPSWPIVSPRDEEMMLEVLRSGKWWYGDRVRQFEQAFAAFQGAKYGITCCNGTIAIDLAIKALGLGAGDEILVPCYTFIATASAVVTAGCVPRFVDVEPHTFNLDLDAAEAAITPRTRALIVVHFAGLPIDLDRARDLCNRHNLVLIEDAAHAWGSQWRGRGISTLGRLGTFSFQMSKNLTCGEGGIILTDDEELATTARSFVNVGRLEGREWYEHFVVTGNYRITEFQAALLLSQMERVEEQLHTRAQNAAILDAGLSSIRGIHVPKNDARVTRRSYHLYPFRYVAEEFGGLPRAAFLKALEAEGIPASPGYPKPLYKQTAFQQINQVPLRSQSTWPGADVSYRDVVCPVAERLCAGEMVWLTHEVLLGTRRDMEQIVEAVQKIHRHQDELKAL